MKVSVIGLGLAEALWFILPGICRQGLSTVQRDARFIVGYLGVIGPGSLVACMVSVQHPPIGAAPFLTSPCLSYR